MVVRRPVRQVDAAARGAVAVLFDVDMEIAAAVLGILAVGHDREDDVRVELELGGATEAAVFAGDGDGDDGGALVMRHLCEAEGHAVEDIRRRECRCGHGNELGVVDNHRRRDAIADGDGVHCLGEALDAVAAHVVHREIVNDDEVV